MEYAYYPLTLFDRMCFSSGVIVGWLVEGHIDISLLEAGLIRLVQKWPLLGGRMEEDEKGQLRVKVPLCAEYPEGYATFVLTSSSSPKPLSTYVKLPIPTFSDVLPDELFLQRTGSSPAPKSPGDWVKNSLPLTYWHVTHFASGHSCIGVTFSHGFLDGMGIATLIHALEAETLGRQWIAPPQLKTGVNDNVMLSFLAGATSSGSQKQDNGSLSVSDYRAISLVGVWYLISMMMRHLWQQVWHGTHSCTILLPKNAYEELVRETREAVEQDATAGKLRLSTGDVLTAWIYKTIYSIEAVGSAHRTTQLSNQASLRMFAPSASINDYPHNCFIPIPYPFFTAAQLQTLPLHVLAMRLARARGGLNISHAAHVYDLLETAAAAPKGISNFRAVMPFNSDVDENMSMSNMSIARVVDIDWSGITRSEGDDLKAGRTLCRYKKLFTESPIAVGNIVTIAGRRGDGSLLLDVMLNKRRMKALKEGVKMLISRAEGNVA